MATFTATIDWQRSGDPSPEGNYPSGHLWRFDGGAEVAASSAPHSMPPPFAVESHVDPEEALVAAAASCHMLFFLFFAQKAGHVVEAYRDAAEGTMARNEEGRMAMTEIRLRPVARYGSPAPDRAAEEALHERAHRACFIANSLKTRISVLLDG